MPYIHPQQRRTVQNVVKDLQHPLLVNCKKGVINYLITTLLWWWMGQSASYEKINDAIGILECVKLELYRRIAAPYEDSKKENNGDVYYTEG